MRTRGGARGVGRGIADVSHGGARGVGSHDVRCVVRRARAGRGRHLLDPTHRAVRENGGGTACEAALAVATGTCDRAFAVVRPPGHHADCGRATGFCFFNNAAVAARVALERGAARRVLILDWDVHHGNGVQDILYEDPRVLYVSLHRYGDGFYPGTGAATEIGAGAGKGFNVNIPWEEKGLGDADYLAAFDLVVDPVAKVSTRISSSSPRDSTPRRAIRWGGCACPIRDTR